MPLDAIFAQHRLTWGFWVLSLAVGLGFLITGIQLDQEEEPMILQLFGFIVAMAGLVVYGLWADKREHPPK